MVGIIVDTRVGTTVGIRAVGDEVAGLTVGCIVGAVEGTFTHALSQYVPVQVIVEQPLSLHAH